MGTQDLFLKKVGTKDHKYIICITVMIRGNYTMCIIIKNNKVIVHDEEDEISEISVLENPNGEIWDLVHETLENYPEEWETHISKNEYCALMKEQMDKAFEDKLKGMKTAYKKDLINLITTVVMAYNKIQ